MTKAERQIHRLQATAYHEAGHAVVGYHNDLKFRYVTIKPSGDALGHVLSPASPKSFNPEFMTRTSYHAIVYWQRRLVTSFAGQFAEGKFLGKHPRHGHDSDDQQAVNVAIELTGSQKQLQKYLDFSLVVAEETVNIFWPDIKAVATALIERETLSFKEVRDVIRATVPKFVPPIVSRGGMS